MSLSPRINIEGRTATECQACLPVLKCALKMKEKPMKALKAISAALAFLVIVNFVVAAGDSTSDLRVLTTSKTA